MVACETGVRVGYGVYVGNGVYVAWGVGVGARDVQLTRTSANTSRILCFIFASKALRCDELPDKTNPHPRVKNQLTLKLDRKRLDRLSLHSLRSF